METRPEKLLTTQEAAAFLNLKPATLITWRSTGAVKLPYVKIGSAIRYRLDDLNAFLNENLKEG